MEFDFIILKSSNGKAELKLNNPDKYNVLNTKTLQEIDSALEIIKNDDKIRVVVLSSSSKKLFTGGADIKEMVTLTPDEAEEFSRLGHKIARKIERELPPVIIGIRGFLMGGGMEFACACDIRIASDTAVFSQPEINIGVIPGWGGTQRLPRIIGEARAKEMIYSGQMIDSTKALEWGIVNDVVPDEKLEERVEYWAGILGSKSRMSLIAAKRSINRSSSHQVRDEGLEYEISQWKEMFTYK